MVLVEQQTFDEHPEIMNRFDSYLHEFHQNNIQGYLDYVHPALFENVPRDLMEESIRSAFNAPGLQFSIDTTEVIRIQGPKKDKNVEYVKLDYAMTMYMRMESDEIEELTDTSEYMDESKLDFMVKMLKMQMGEENVSVQEGDNTIVLSPPASLYAIKDESLGDAWYFLDVNQTMPGFLNKIVPKKIQKQFD